MNRVGGPNALVSNPTILGVILPMVQVYVLVLPGGLASSLAITHDVLETAN